MNLQHSDHVAAYYWHKSKQLGETWQSEAYYHASQDYGLAARDAKHATKFFRH